MRFTFVTTAVPHDADDEALRQSVARVRSVLERSGCEFGTEQEALFEFVLSQMARYDFLRDNPFTTVPHHLGNYWRNWLLTIVQTGSYRPSFLRRLLIAMDPERPISRRMLTLNLRLLERDGLIARTVCDEDGRHVEYSLTPLGKDFYQLLTSLTTWIARHADEIDEARATFDAVEAVAPGDTTPDEGSASARGESGLL